MYRPVTGCATQDSLEKLESKAEGMVRRRTWVPKSMCKEAIELPVRSAGSVWAGCVTWSTA
jgi:hypothetical protein